MTISNICLFYADQHCALFGDVKLDRLVLFTCWTIMAVVGYNQTAFMCFFQHNIAFNKILS